MSLKFTKYRLAAPPGPAGGLKSSPESRSRIRKPIKETTSKGRGREERGGEEKGEEEVGRGKGGKGGDGEGKGSEG